MGSTLKKEAMWVMGMAAIASSLPLLGSGVIGLSYYLIHQEGGVRGSLILLAYGFIYLGFGVVLYRRGFGARIEMGEAVALTAVVWIVVPLLSAVPFMEASGVPFIDSLFESVSGWSTTGLTVLSGSNSSWRGVYVPRVEELDVSLKFWRTLMQWEGGLGIVIFTIAILAPPGVSAATLYLAEGKFERLEASFRRSAVLMGLIYLALTGLGVLLFRVSGMPLIDSIHHAMTGIATAGFSTHTESLGYYIGSSYILVSAMIVMFLGAVSFSDHYNMLRLKFDRLRRSVELKAQIVILVLASLTGLFIWSRDPIFRESQTPLTVVFHVVSASATAGFQAGDLHSTSESFKMLLALLCIVGGSAFSTAGGIKVMRLLIAFKSVSMEADKLVHPLGYVPKRMLGTYMLDEELMRKTLATITIFIFTYAILVMAAIAIAPSYDPVDVVFEIASAMGNVGLSTGVTSASAPIAVKAILMIAMLLGRLEVLTYIVAVNYLKRSLTR